MFGVSGQKELSTYTIMFTLIILFTYSGVVFTQKSNLTFTAQPPKLLLGDPHSPKLTLACSPTDPAIITVFQMAIGKNISDGSESEIVRISSGAPNTVSITDASLGLRLKAFGSIAAQSSKNLQVELSPPECDDAANYYCKSVYLTTAGSVGQSQVSISVSAIKSPDSLKITANPQKAEYDIDSEVTLTCSGKLGNTVDIKHPEKNWSWEWRNDSTEAWMAFSASENITYNSPVRVDNCTFSGSSDLMYTLTEEDVSLQFRCLVDGKFTATSEITVKPKPTPVYPSCDEAGLMAAVSEQKTIVSNDSAGFCSNGQRERSEAVLMEFCEAPETSLWVSGPKVMDMCDTLAPQTPIALFQFGLYVDNNAGLSGVFMGCSDNGFTMATQICGHPVSLYHLDMRIAEVSEAENPNRYHVVVYQKPSTTHRPILVG